MSTSLTVAQKVARRIAERNGWETYSEPTVRMVCKFYVSLSREMSIPAKDELDKMLPIATVNWGALRNPVADKIQCTWIGHATCFVQTDGFNIITDPIFSKRCSATQLFGPARFRDPACTIQNICVDENVGIDVILISHNHYDHLDYNSVRELAYTAIKTNRPVQFVVALGLKKWFTYYTPDSMKGGNDVAEIDWHETFTVEGKDDNRLELTGIPMQHWSNRTGFDRDKSLWCGFAVKSTSSTSSSNFLFSGDTGWFNELHDTGELYGPFDLAAIPIGAYHPRSFMKPMHTNPEDSVKMMDAVKAKKALAIHWGTFPLTTEPILEPRERLEEAMEAAGKDKSTFLATLIGETTLS